VPWCDSCSKFWNPPSVGEKGECPTCGRVITKSRPKAPWHFKLLLVALAVYLVYRAYWFATWLPHHI
jgi:DNA-directed RNA polymerase subunit RPC12/RpoP